MSENPISVAGQKRKNEPTASSSSQDGGTPKKKKAAKPKKPLDSRFGGKTEEELMQLLLPDHLKPDLDIVFIGINPGLLSAYLGHHYCNANNHFWPCMYESGLIPRRMTYKEDAECLDHGIGFTNIVPRTTRSSNDLTRKEIKEWSEIMCNRMKELRPLVACFNGKGIYEIFTGKKCEVGLQPVPLPDTQTVVYVMPSTSGRAASHPRRVDKLKFFHELKQLRDDLKSKKRPIPNQTSTDTSVPVTIPTNTSAQVSSSTFQLPTVPALTTSVPPVSLATVPMVNTAVVPPIIPGSSFIPVQGVSYKVIQQGVPTPIVVSPYFTPPTTKSD